MTIVPDGPTIPVETTVFCGDRKATQGGRTGKEQLSVEATFLVPQGGYQVELRRAERQGRNPKDLWLQVVVREPDGPVVKQPTKLVARYEEESGLFYDTVTILPNRAGIEVDHGIFRPSQTG